MNRYNKELADKSRPAKQRLEALKGLRILFAVFGAFGCKTSMPVLEIVRSETGQVSAPAALLYDDLQTALKRPWEMLDCQVSILLHGEASETVQVNPGDFIFGDYDGLMVIPKDLTGKVLEECERVMGIEDNARLDFARGEDPVAVFERHKRL